MFFRSVLYLLILSCFKKIVKSRNENTFDYCFSKWGFISLFLPHPLVGHNISRNIWMQVMNRDPLIIVSFFAVLSQEPDGSRSAFSIVFLSLCRPGKMKWIGSLKSLVATGKCFPIIIRNLAWAAIVYYIWQERNCRVFKEFRDFQPMFFKKYNSC